MGVEVSGFLVTSTLLVSHAVLGDAGPYSCALPVFSNKGFPRAKANVHVIYGITIHSVMHYIVITFTGDHAAVQGGALSTHRYSR